ncbi:hypothetical protein HNQ08_004514 [Deinococcus humi]|uniref:Uncharacterized protein n=1 Tax=Deinococcus humi TaxID=662880 RepID=A0A7W8JYY6_9DEIO|nr:hypothetical protein [Deinococcus humi]GGO36053.1 hypothetical protein GCM10008949_39440 [Deinococcus humi]
MSTVVVESLEVSGNGDAGVLLMVRNAGMQGKEFLYSPWVLEADLAPLLLPGGPMGLLDQMIAARREINWMCSIRRARMAAP